MTHIQTILHPTDFSDSSKSAYRVACALARDYGARLIVLHVAQPPVVIYDEAGRLLPHRTDYREAAMRELAKLPLPGELVRVEHRLGGGEAAAEILRVARESGADLIVVGTQGRTGLARVLIGSVAEDVLREAPCPVLTVRQPLPAAVARVAPAPARAAAVSGC
jgi:nucleotide-binding universal stress UspA family protein